MWVGNDTSTMFVRRDDSSIPQMGLMIVPPKNTGPYRLFEVKSIPMAWPVEDADAHLLQVVSRWTAYATRKKFEDFLMQEMEVPSNKAFAAAIGLTAIMNDDSPREE